MKTLTLRINSNTDHYDEDFGPPLPKSLYLWGIWGCYNEDHVKCVTSSKMKIGGKWETVHEHVGHVYTEHVRICRNNPSCRYFVHYLAGDLEEPGEYGDRI